MLAFRLTRPSKDLTSFYDRLDQSSEKYIIYEHNERDDNIHIHGFIVGCTVSTDTLKNWIKKDVGKVKSTEWSFKTATDDKFITYMSKGKLEPIKVFNFNLNYVTELKDAWVPMGKKNKEKSDKEKKTIYQLAEEIDKTVKSQMLCTTFVYKEKYRIYLKTAISVCHKYRQGFEEFYLRRLVSTAMTIDLCIRDQYIQRVMEKEFREYNT